MKKFLMSIIFIIFLIILFPLNVKANSIDSINMDIYIDQNGNANITEVWTCNVNQGTESYHPYYNLEKSKITNLSVTESGKRYTTLNAWDTSGTLNSKAYKCGLNHISNGVEICWGISDYGSHKYEVKYTITNFVSELTDAQMIYWTLIPYEFSNTIGKAYVKIHTYYNMPNTTDVWGYGNYGGTCYVYDGYIEMASKGKLKSNEYMTILAKLPKGKFNTTSVLDNDFNYYLNMAEQDTTKYKENKRNEKITIFIMFFYVIVFGVVILIIHILTIPSVKEKSKIKVDKKFLKEAKYYREIPCEEDLFEIYFIAYIYGMLRKETDLLGACILKWIKDGNAKIEKKEIHKWFKTKEEKCVSLQKKNEFENPLENDLYDMLYDASKDGILEKNELERWCSYRFTKFLYWFKSVKFQAEKKLRDEGKIEVEKYGEIEKYEATQQLKEYALQIKGFKNYLKDYSLLNEREPKEVVIFENFLIYAQMFGIADKVSKQFKELYPETLEEMNFNYNDIIFIHEISTTGVSSAIIAKSAAEAEEKAKRYGSGGGSSSGGGFSSGGGRRRLIRRRRRPEEVSVKI